MVRYLGALYPFGALRNFILPPALRALSTNGFKGYHPVNRSHQRFSGIYLYQLGTLMRRFGLTGQRSLLHGPLYSKRRVFVCE